MPMCLRSAPSRRHRRNRPASPIARFPAADAPRPGSNNFAVAGSLTDSGAAMLANDMHLGLRVPNIWFRARLRYPDPARPNGQRDVNGVSLPGTPAIIVGSNGQIAWGFTNSYGDWLDWVRVLRDPANPPATRCPKAGPNDRKSTTNTSRSKASRTRPQGRGHALGPDHGQRCRRHAAGAGLDRRSTARLQRHC
jgi:hypothetical protein